jgi:bifunctional DNase/RNase
MKGGMAEGSYKIMDEVELKVHDMSSTLQPADAYALVLEEVNGERKLPIIIGAVEAQAIKVEMMEYKPPRPLTHDLFLTLMKEVGIELKKVLIYKVKDGVYYSYLFIDKEGQELKIDSRTSDAIALAMRCGCPIYTTDEIIESEQLIEAGDKAFTVKVNMLSIDILKESLAKAVEEEDYEQASHLRDEIRRREMEAEDGE